MEKRQLIFIGAPGSGKGTQATRVVKKCGYQHISTGDLLRNEVKKQSALGVRISSLMSSGTLVDDMIVMELLASNCDVSKHAYIFDGFPRNIKQAEMLESGLLKNIAKRAIYFEIDLKVLIERLVNRRTCEGCGKIFNLVHNPPQTIGKCDACGKGLIHRSDDTEQVVKNRIDVFLQTVTPLLDFYESRGELVRINANQAVDKIEEELDKNI